ncbi:putative alpha-isopropylmalate/homocitrate synthase family transferase [Streptomyces sp. YIM 130001]|uniref:alpha-isopropylmalate synthase regulatory domain-containing protein n=1 Tax=Streptomyces sp. YIM 130001 TaxID=2259644 RepID=UPI000EC6DE62|nr:alpha-isopropylmalate synthase regulatory domain-containing protein [Streptomyces sp. YIM 130001]RII14216.1 putative alpha-isopropylmalate/homocitrate synthase family transferase [Streptomyces sp. YIM 130001]
MKHHDVTALDDPVFQWESWRVISEDATRTPGAVDATVKILVHGERSVAAAEGNGPVNALEQALRQALRPSHPDVARLELVDCTIRVVESRHGTAGRSSVEVSVTDGHALWRSESVSHNVLSAACEALQKAFTYGLLRVPDGVDDGTETSPGTPTRPELGPVCRLTVTARHSGAALGRIVATLNSIPVGELTYEVSGTARARAELVVPRADAALARRRLDRMVDVLTVTESRTAPH